MAAIVLAEVTASVAAIALVAVIVAEAIVLARATGPAAGKPREIAAGAAAQSRRGRPRVLRVVRGAEAVTTR